MKKKVVATALSAVVLTSVLAGCNTGGQEPNVPESAGPAVEEPVTPPEEPSGNDTDANDDASDTDNEMADGSIRTSVGVVTSVDSSRQASDDQAARAQVDSVVAVVTIDSDGVIQNLSIDAAQTRVEIEHSGTVVTDGVELRSKGELGDEYNMRRNSEIEKEWFEQIEAFVDFARGKTLDEIRGITLEDGKIVADAEPDLAASVTITATSYIQAIENAFANNTPAAEVTGATRTGMGMITDVGGSNDATSEANGRVQVDTTIAAITIDENGVIVNAFIDVAQTRIPVTVEGVLEVDGVNVLTKHGLGNNYNMRANSGIDKEWFEQADALSAYLIGKTADEVSAIVLDESGSPDADNSPDLAASVTITVSTHLEAVQKAIANARS